MRHEGVRHDFVRERPIGALLRPTKRGHILGAFRVMTRERDHSEWRLWVCRPGLNRPSLAEQLHKLGHHACVPRWWLIGGARVAVEALWQPKEQCQTQIGTELK